MTNTVAVGRLWGSRLISPNQETRPFLNQHSLLECVVIMGVK